MNVHAAHINAMPHSSASLINESHHDSGTYRAPRPNPMRRSSPSRTSPASSRRATSRETRHRAMKSRRRTSPRSDPIRSASRWRQLSPAVVAGTP